MIAPVPPSIASSSLQGMQKAQAQLNKTAANIAALPAAADTPPTTDTLDLSTDMVNLISARDNFMANVGAAKTGDEMQRTLLNMIA